MASAELDSLLSDQELEMEALEYPMAEEKTTLDWQLDNREKEVADRKSNIFLQESGVVEREQSLVWSFEE